MDVRNPVQQNLSKPKPPWTEEYVQLRQGFGLQRFKLHRHLVDVTVESVWFRQVFGLLRVTVFFTFTFVFKILQVTRGC